MRNIDWSNEQNMENFTFTAKDVVIRFVPRLKIWTTAFFGRKSFKHDFMLKNGIKKTDRISSAVLPKFYVVNNKRIDYIAGIRDSIVEHKYKEYKEIQQSLNCAINEVKYDAVVAEKNLKTQNEILQDSKNKLTAAKRTKNSINIISYQAAIESQKTSIKANELRAAVIKNNLASLQDQNEKNLKQWKNQVELIESAVLRLTQLFEANITKQVKREYNFGNFETSLRGYSSPIKNIISGEKY